ncbi:DUF5000 domain-containing lipoprotein [Pedobacter faecalis]|uniref:DUF5000 domain-containing lipoprotein n=1 Tax=Pedobacter faecalis TaxID=3041495 RepID=UPI00254B4410|nr:DUF4998 domain-containing protein [Pedobacter sp. ELA7]
MKTIFHIALIAVATFTLASCKKYADDYKEFLENKEITYPGLATNVGYQAGNLRTVLYWSPSPDPSIKSYLVTWNNGADSLVVNATSNDPAVKMSVSIPNLNEYVYSFKIVARDAQGNKSVGQELNNVRVYGPAYIASLINRSHDAANPYVVNSPSSVVLHFNKADSANFSTKIRYTNTSDVVEEKVLAPDENSVTLTNYKFGTPVQYKSAYKPEKTAADAFEVGAYSDFPVIKAIVEYDKALFAKRNLPTDIRSEYGWELQYLWDKKTAENAGPGFHTPGTSMPQWFTVDLGVKAKLDHFRVWQRTSALYDVGNLKQFELWGSNDPSSDGSFSSWTKLGTFNSFKPSGLPKGQVSDADRNFAAAGEKFTVEGLPEYRYVRFKVLETWGGANYLHLMELSFFKQL